MASPKLISSSRATSSRFPSPSSAICPAIATLGTAVSLMGERSSWAPATFKRRSFPQIDNARAVHLAVWTRVLVTRADRQKVSTAQQSAENERAVSGSLHTARRASDWMARAPYSKGLVERHERTDWRRSRRHNPARDYAGGWQLERQAEAAFRLHPDRRNPRKQAQHLFAIGNPGDDGIDARPRIRFHRQVGLRPGANLVDPRLEPSKHRHSVRQRRDGRVSSRCTAPG